MIDINFLTPEYKYKLLFKNLAKVAGVLVILVLLILGSGNMYLKGIISKKQQEIAKLNNDIKQKKKQTEEVRKKMTEIPDLTNSIQIVEDIFSQQNLRISEVLYTIQEEVPANVYLHSLTYEGDNIRFSGKAEINKKLKLNSYENVFQFERNLKNSGKFINIEADYIEKIVDGKNEISSFSYDMQLKIN